jgi:hypothetical protein
MQAYWVFWDMRWNHIRWLRESMVLLNDLWAGESEPKKKEQLVVAYVGVRGRFSGRQEALKGQTWQASLAVSGAVKRLM